MKFRLKMLKNRSKINQKLTKNRKITASRSVKHLRRLPGGSLGAPGSENVGFPEAPRELKIDKNTKKNDNKKHQKNNVFLYHFRYQNSLKHEVKSLKICVRNKKVNFVKIVLPPKRKHYFPGSEATKNR